MRFYEFESKALFGRRGLPLAKSRVATSAAEARAAAAAIGGPVVLKSQVLSGGRMKAGAVKFADTPDQAAAHFDAIVDVEQSHRLLAKLRAAGVRAELFEEPWSGHSTAYLLEGESFRAAVAFLAEQMPPR